MKYATIQPTPLANFAHCRYQQVVVEWNNPILGYSNLFVNGVESIRFESRI